MAMSHTDETITVKNVVHKEVQDHKGWFLGSGLFLILLGALSIIFPAVASISLELLLGAILTASGLLGLFHAFRLKNWKGHTFTLINSLLGLGLGILLLSFPLEGLISLSILIGVFFVLSGVFKMALAFAIKPLDHWGWTLTGGAISLILGVVILGISPQAPWILGVLLGVDLIIAGTTFTFLSTQA